MIHKSILMSEWLLEFFKAFFNNLLLFLIELNIIIKKYIIRCIYFINLIAIFIFELYLNSSVPLLSYFYSLFIFLLFFLPWIFLYWWKVIFAYIWFIKWRLFFRIRRALTFIRKWIRRMLKAISISMRWKFIVWFIVNLFEVTFHFVLFSTAVCLGFNYKILVIICLLVNKVSIWFITYCFKLWHLNEI